MSKLTKALIPGYGANPTKPNSNPLSGLAPNLETGLPQGLPSGIGSAALKYSNPVGGFAPDVNGDIDYRKGWLDTSSNGTPDAKQTTTTGPRTVWGDPDLTKRGWGWGMDSNGKLQTGVMGSGPAGTPWGIPGSSQGGLGGYGPPAPAAGTNTGVASPSAVPGTQSQGPMTPLGPGGLRGLVNTGQQLAAQMRQGASQGQGGMSANTPGMGPYMQSQGGPATGAGAPQMAAGMGGQPGAPGGAAMTPQQFAPQMPGMQAYGQGQGQGIQALIAQLRQQQPQVGMGQSAQ